MEIYNRSREIRSYRFFFAKPFNFKERERVRSLKMLSKVPLTELILYHARIDFGSGLIFKILNNLN